ncbi:LysR substrate-binding domain-containing protein [Chromobacterium haemolyticum]|uniref:LysR substrate-binding domain-containing protein n=1 Tax=Chromobacterium haemolyticum TaxID=394935 RepID=UPI0005BA9FD2|nr:LysR substrate-binding domain-containing protein [Chromobacterium haemolyticum]OQS38465.1 LysR family transcriptional regulator [Chromobacterium haemolyticum]PTU70942.1 LysR family transcriptional regulator [Chromobacterium haemolyticum]BBH13115.1 galactose-binding protein [Chromobacterium haemolyticum]
MDPLTPFSVQDMVLNRLKLRPLLVFDRVLRCQSIARAARELNLTQPAVTKAIRELEQQLDTVLFLRGNRGVTPTEYGLLLGERVKAVIAELRYLTDEINAFKGGICGHVIVGTQISASASLLPQAILRLKAHAPKLLVTVREGPQDYLFPALAAGELDLVVGRLPDPEAPLTRKLPLRHQPLYLNRLCIVAGGHHPLLAAPPSSLAELRDWPWILPPPDSPARLVAEQFFHNAGLALPDNLLESLSLLTNVNLLVDSDCLGLMPRLAARRFAAAKLLAVLPLDEVGPPTAVGYSVRADKPLPPAARQMIDSLKLAAAQLDAADQV